MGNTTGTIKLPSSDNDDVIEANERLKKFLTENPNLLINKSPREISQLVYDQTGQPILNKECLERLCSSIKQIIEESFEISSNIFDHGDNYRNRVIEEHFKDFKIREIDIQLVDCEKTQALQYKKETITSKIAVTKITDIFKYICKVSGNNSEFIKKIFDCLLDEDDKKLYEQKKLNEQHECNEPDNPNPKVSRNELNKELSIFWDYNYQDPKGGSGMYKKRKTNKSKKSRKHIRSRRLSRSRRPAKSRRYKKSRK
jgi:hypothetical protein